jgi:hypothetical protein
MQFKVIESIDYLDPNPSETLFPTRWEADEHVGERIFERVDYAVQHSTVMLSEKEYEGLIEYESTFFNVVEID